MSRIFLFTILSGLVIAVITAINLRDVNVHEDSKFIPISVLSKKQANYGVDANLLNIPAVSVDILEDKMRDMELESSIPIIRYTSLPVTKDEATDQGNTQSNDQDNPGNDKHPQTGGGNSSQDKHDNGKGNSNQNKNDNEKNNSNNGQDKETRPEKKILPENKDNKIDKPGKIK